MNAIILIHKQCLKTNESWDALTMKENRDSNTRVQPKQKNQPEPFFFILTIDESWRFRGEKSPADWTACWGKPLQQPTTDAHYAWTNKAITACINLQLANKMIQGKSSGPSVVHHMRLKYKTAWCDRPIAQHLAACVIDTL